MKTITTLLLLLVVSFTVNSQNTTNTEYNYMIKGIKFQIENGLDTKRGYDLKPLKKIQQGNYTFNYFVLLRNKEALNYNNGPYVGIVVIADSNVSGKRYFKAIPAQTVTFDKNAKKRNEILNEAFKEEIEIWDSKMTTAYAVATSKVFASQISLFAEPFTKK